MFGVGEHHRKDYAASSPAMVLSAAAPQTKKIRLASAVTVLSSADPVRVFQIFLHWMAFQMDAQRLWRVVVPLSNLFHCLAIT